MFAGKECGNIAVELEDRLGVRRRIDEQQLFAEQGCRIGSQRLAQDEQRVERRLAVGIEFKILVQLRDACAGFAARFHEKDVALGHASSGGLGGAETGTYALSAKIDRAGFNIAQLNDKIAQFSRQIGDHHLAVGQNVDLCLRGHQGPVRSRNRPGNRRSGLIG